MALYIVLENPLVDTDIIVDGKALSRAEPELADIAARLGVVPLMDYFSMDPTEAEEFLAVADVDYASLGIELREAQWFSATEGLKTINGLLQYLQQEPGMVKDVEAVLRDLRECQRMLEAAEKHQIRWHLAVDY